jgi:uncharacterized protein YbjT (DUF2867 family)
MAEPLFVITGASGHVGGIIASRLLDQKKRVRVIGRSADHLKKLVERGAEAAIGTLEDSAFARKAFDGAQAVFVMIPPNFVASDFRAYQTQMVNSVVEAIKGAKVPYVVSLSSIGAHLSEGNGPVAGLYELEQKLNKISGINVLHLRPAYFMENNLANIAMIKGMGLNGGALRPDLAMPMIATQDIGEVAAKRVSALDFTGTSVLELMGPRDVTPVEVTKALGKAIGKPELPYQQFPYEDAKKAMVGAGIPEKLAGLYMEMTRGFNEGKIVPTQPRSPQNTTPTTPEAFAEKVFAVAFRS